MYFNIPHQDSSQLLVDEDMCDSDSRANLKDYLEDEEKAKSTGGFLFADCLSSKSKKYRDQL